MFELTVHFEHKMIGFLPKFQRNFELTVLNLYFEAYMKIKTFMVVLNNYISNIADGANSHCLKQHTLSMSEPPPFPEMRDLMNLLLENFD